MRLLLLEDDARLSGLLVESFTRSGFAVDCAQTIEAAWDLVRSQSYDALVLDRRLPDGDGLMLVERARGARLDVPILMLTVRDAWQDKVEALSTGADDYLAKPFRTEELLARVRAIVRRRHGESSGVIRRGSITLDEGRQTVQARGAIHVLTGAEFRLLRFLMLNAGRVLSRSRLHEHIYDGRTESGSNVIEVHISHLRGKLGANAITTRRGQGYVFSEGSTEDSLP